MNIRPSFPFTVPSRDVWLIALPASLAFITEPLWIAINMFFVTRAVIFFAATRWKLPQLFPA